MRRRSILCNALSRLHNLEGIVRGVGRPLKEERFVTDAPRGRPIKIYEGYPWLAARGCIGNSMEARQRNFGNQKF